MRFKGSDNPGRFESTEEHRAYAEGWERIFGKKEREPVVGKQYYVDGRGWVSEEEYKAERPQESNILIAVDRPCQITITKPDGDWRKGEMTGFKKERVMKKMFV